MKVAVIGSRSARPETLSQIMDVLPAGCSEIISGGAAGVDLLAERVADTLRLRYTCIRPRYRRYGRVAPLIRNRMIVDQADLVLAFWDGRSKGTRQALGYCISSRKPFRIFLIGSQSMRMQDPEIATQKPLD